MRNISISKVYASGFLSIDQPLVLDISKGFYVVTGENLDDSDGEQRSNGSGKTTVFTALEFAFFGSAKGLVKSEIPFNGVNKSSCHVFVEFTISDESESRGFRVTRDVNPSKLVLEELVDGEYRNISQSESVATQSHIERLLGIPFHIFNQCLCLKINDKTSTFLKFGKVDREKFVNIVFDLTKFKNMEKEVRSDFNSCSNELDKTEAIRNETASRVSVLKEQARQAEEVVRNKIATLIENRKIAVSELESASKEADEKIAILDERVRTETLDRDRAREDALERKQVLLRVMNESMKTFEDGQRASESPPDFDGERISLETKRSKLMEISSKLSQDIDEARRDIKQGDAVINRMLESALCGECGRQMPDHSDSDSSEKIRLWDNRKTELNGVITELREKILKGEDVSKIISEKMGDLDRRVREHAEIKASIERLRFVSESDSQKYESFDVEREISNHELRVENAKRERSDFDPSVILSVRKGVVDSLDSQILSLESDETVERIRIAVVSAESDKAKIDEQFKEIQERLEILKQLKTVSSEDGVRQYIMTKLITLFNNRLAYFLKRFESPFDVVFDGSFEPTIHNTNKREVSYSSLSGGEQKRVDLAVSFTFLDILRAQNQIQFNFSVYDEILDTSIDRRGMEQIVEYLREGVELHGSAVYLITHRENFEVEGSRNIHMTKKNHRTTMEIR